MQARFQFEMLYSAGQTIRRLMQIPASLPDVLVTRLETLVQDVELKEYSRIFDFLALDAAEREVLL